MIRKYKNPRIYICDRIDYYFGNQGTWHIKQELMEPATKDLPLSEDFFPLNKISIREWREILEDNALINEEMMMDRFMEETLNHIIDRLNILIKTTRIKWKNKNQGFHQSLK